MNIAFLWDALFHTTGERHNKDVAGSVVTTVILPAWMEELEMRF